MNEADIRKKKKEALLAKMDADRAVMTTQMRLAEAPQHHRTGLEKQLSPGAVSILSKYGYLLSAAIGGIGVIGPKVLTKLIGVALRRLVRFATGLVVQKVVGPAPKSLPAKRRR